MDSAIYRIIDANFNRAREAVRVVEEFCRFGLNSEPLAKRAKQLRHELCFSIAKLDSERLISSRDTEGDVGTEIKLKKQHKRSDLEDCFTAACKRLTEALRVLSEMIQTIDPVEAEKLEKQRYCFYTLEKDISFLYSTCQKFSKVKLYIVITSESADEVLSLTKDCILGKADCIQLRTKSMPGDELFDLAVKFANLCRAASVISIINDRPDIAIACGADGVHLGQNDLPIEQVRRLQSRPMIIGKSTHSMEQLRKACDQNVTYVGLGPVFSTPTKPTAKAVGFEYVTQASEFLKTTAIKGVAIGGINTDNITDVLNCGPDVIAVCSAVTKAPKPAKACMALKGKMINSN